MECFTVKDLSFRYPGAARQALCEISFSVRDGEFLTICGLSGCGKSTLLRQFKTCLQPFGEQSGTILYRGQSLSEVPLTTQAAAIGFVQQSPEHQSVTDKVWHELAFGLESLGQSRSVIRQRVAETASFFGMEGWYERPVHTLSGGQKQLLHLASAMVLQPSVLVLDEPTAQLDPIAAQELVGWLRRINTELGTTILLSEHHLGEVYALSDRILVLSEGQLLSDAPPQQTSRALYQAHHAFFLSLPSPTRIFEQLPHGTDQTPPLSASQGRQWLQAYLPEHPPKQAADGTTSSFLGKESGGEPSALATSSFLGRGCGCPVDTSAGGRSTDRADRREGGEPFVPTKGFPQRNSPEKEVFRECREVWFRYEKDTPDILKSCSLTIHRGELLTILGGNGTGKTTLLSLLAGCQKPYRGQLLQEGHKVPLRQNAFRDTALLPQDPKTLFVRSTVREELYDMLSDSGLSSQEQEERLHEVIELCGIAALLPQHPYDLSGGEQQKAALAKVLLTRPKLLLLDEPTKGLDHAYQRRLVQILHRLTAEGTAVVAVSHDIAFCADYADRCALLFNGQIVSEGRPKAFFAANSLYTTDVCRMTKGLLPQTVTVKDVLSLWDADQQEETFTDDTPDPPPDHQKPPSSGTLAQKRTSWRRRIGGFCLRGILLAVCIMALLCSAGLVTLPLLSDDPAVSYTVLFVSGILWLFVSVRGKQPLPIVIGSPPTCSAWIAALTVFGLIPLTVGLGFWLLEDTKYLFVSLLVLLESTVPFFWLFEKRRVPTRELVLLAVLCAVCVGGRALFYMLPACKPVTALVILSAVALGSESGFLIGSTAMLVSNFFFGQGLWTPWQMMAMGLVGYGAGWLFHRGRIPATRASVAVYGFVAAIVLYGGIMNPTTLLLSRTPFTLPAVLSVYAVGLPSDTVHAVVTALFLCYGAEPLLGKIERIQKKYGLLR